MIDLIFSNYSFIAFPAFDHGGGGDWFAKNFTDWTNLRGAGRIRL